MKLPRAFQLELDQAAALKPPSWGKFQILGEYCKACGFATVADFVKAMTISEIEHLKAFVKFLPSSSKRLQAIRKKDWRRWHCITMGPTTRNSSTTRSLRLPTPSTRNRPKRTSRRRITPSACAVFLE